MYVQLGEDEMTTPYRRERRRNIERTAKEIDEKRLDRDREMFKEMEQ